MNVSRGVQDTTAMIHGLDDVQIVAIMLPELQELHDLPDLDDL
jgi:hypothetical protein